MLFLLLLKKNNVRKGLVLIILFCAVLVGCNKKEAVVPFTHATMKPWFDTHCKNCHADGGSAIKDWEYDSDDFNNTIKKYISDIHHEVAVSKSMPPNGLNASDLQAFVDWYNAGYPIQ